MEWTYYLIIYLAAVNILGFISAAVNSSLKKRGKKLRLDILTAILAFLGGSLGAIISILITDPKPEKENMMSRVFIGCIFIIQVLLLLFFILNQGKEINFNLFEFFFNIPLLIYLGIINIVTFIFFAADKRKAENNRPRIKIITLLGLCFIGGSAGGLLGMYLLRHKTKKNYFTVGIPLIILTHLVLIFFIINL